MILSTTDSTRFYQIWWPLLKFVNTKEIIIDNFPEDPYIEGVNLHDAVKIRNVLWSSSDLLDDFIRANPLNVPIHISFLSRIIVLTLELGILFLPVISSPKCSASCPFFVKRSAPPQS